MDFVGGAQVPAKLDLPTAPRLARPPRKPRQPMETGNARRYHARPHCPGRTGVVKGVGPKMSKLFNQLGIFTINDLLFYLPRRYDDYTKMLSIRRLQANQLVTVIGTVRHTEVRIGSTGAAISSWSSMMARRQLNVTFFGQHYLQRQIKPGTSRSSCEGKHRLLAEPHSDEQPGMGPARPGGTRSRGDCPRLPAHRRHQRAHAAQTDASRPSNTGRNTCPTTCRKARSNAPIWRN